MEMAIDAVDKHKLIYSPAEGFDWMLFHTECIVEQPKRDKLAQSVISNQDERTTAELAAKTTVLSLPPL